MKKNAFVSKRLGKRLLGMIGAVVGLLAGELLAAEAPPFTVAENGQALAVIQVPEKAPPAIVFAAQELKGYLEKITGAAFLIQNKIGPAEGLRRIVLGDCEESRKAGLDISTLPIDGFFLRQAGDALYVCGRDDPTLRKNELIACHYKRHGTLMAVYGLLEDVCGVRWLFPGELGEFIPKNPTLTIPSLDMRAKPGMKMRTVYWGAVSQDWVALYGAKRASREVSLFKLRMRFSSWFMATSHYFAYEHSASRWVNTHPEYFLEGKDGKRILKRHPGQGWYLDFTNPGLAHEVALDAIAYFQGKPAETRGLPQKQFNMFGYGQEVLAINPADTSIRSARDKKERPQVTDSDVLWTYYKRVSDEVAAACPGKILSVWSYGEAAALPTIMTNALDNTRIYLVTGGPFGWMVDDQRVADERRMKEWSVFAGHKMYMWVNMGLRLCRPRILSGVPSPVTKTMGPWMKAISPYFEGVYFHNSSAEGMFEAVNSYLYFHLAWNPNADPETILKDYYAKAYGPAGGIIRGMEQEFEEIWKTRILTNAKMGERMQGNVSTLPTLTEVWEEIYNQAVIDKLQEKMAKAEAVAKGTEFEKRVNVFAEHYLGAILRERLTYFNHLNLSDDMIIHAARATGPVTLDGKMDEPAWQKCEAVTMVPLNANEKPVVKTQVRMLYDSNCLYAVFQCQEPQMDSLRTKAKGLDKDIIWKDDEVEVLLDPSKKRRSHYQLMVNAAGAMTDYWHHDCKIDKDWSSNARVAIAKGADAWTIEIAIPFAGMNSQPPKPGDRWLGNFCRGRALNKTKPGESQVQTWIRLIKDSSWLGNFCHGQALTKPKRGKSQVQTWSRLIKESFDNPIGFGTIVFTDDAGKDPAEKLNLLVNDGFEAGTKGWGGQKIAVDETIRWKDAKSMRMELKAGSDDLTKNPAFLQCFGAKIKTNTMYVLTYYMKTSDVTPIPGKTVGVVTGAGAELHLRGDRWNACPNRWVTGTTDWRKYVVWVNSGAKPNPTAAIRFRMRDCTGTTWIDNVELREKAAEPR